MIERKIYPGYAFSKCRDLVYGKALKKICVESDNCDDCWSEPMPEEPGGDE